MFCRSCGTELPDDANFCLKCGVRVHTGKIAVPERTLSSSEVDHLRWSDWLDDYCFEGGATLEVTNKRVRVEWDRHTLDIPLNRVGRVETKKGDWWRNHELSIAGVGVFRFDKYEELDRVAQIINSLTPP